MKKLLALSLLTMGCKPMDVAMDGQWWTWLSANSSLVVDEGNIPDLEDNATIIECTGRGWDEEEEEWDPTYIGPKTFDEAKDPRFVGGDPSGWCARDDSGDWDSECEEVALATIAECEGSDDKLGVQEAEFYTFLFEDGQYALQGALEPTRTEALIHGENDLQISMMQKMGNGQEFRFLVAIATDFNPTTCTSNGESAEIKKVDGADWIEQWSVDEDGNSIYYLNASALQVNQSDSSGNNTFWYLITDWSAGFGFANFMGEEFYSVPTSYGNYDVDGAGNYGFEFVGSDAGFVAVTEGERSSSEVDGDTAFDDLPDEMQDAYNDRLDSLVSYSSDWTHELLELGGAHTGVCSDGVCDCADGLCFEQKVEDNKWRPVDSQLAGLDGWMEVHSSWVRFDKGSDLSVGGSAKGDYQILFQGELTSSRLLVKGTFDIEEIKEDRWTYGNLEEEKRADTSEGHQGKEYCK
jgi:hypothetical protein